MSLPPAPPRRRDSAFLVLGLSLIGISFAAPLVRLAAASALTIAAWRLALSLIIVGAALVVGGHWREWRTMTARDLAFAAGAGVLLALHFWTWNLSLRMTSVAASVSLVNLQPVIIAVVSARWLREPPTRRTWTGILIAVAGALIVGVADIPGGLRGLGGANPLGSRALLGDLLAAVGALAGALYFLIGRLLRQRLSVWPYVALVYSAALCTCLLLSLATGDVMWPQPQRELAIFVGLAIGPMLLGHTGMNWALGRLPAYLVNLTTLGEPIGATLLAAFLPGIAETPGVGTIIGGAVVLVGVLIAARRDE